MFQLGGLEQTLRLEHRHEDGSWSSLEPRPSQLDPAAHDPERDWAKGRIYVCAGCNQEVRIMDAASEGTPVKP